jgi:hypothetical protein
LADTDGDGLDDAVELTWSADPTVEDTDSDCLKDGEEADLAALPLGTPPTGVAVALRLDATDSDGDLLADGAELNMPDCLLATGVLSDPTFLHSDEDEVDDGAEVRGDGLAYTCAYASCASDPMDADSDDDDVTDNTERDDGMNPTDVDSDGDDLEDGDEVSWGAITGASVSHYAADASLPDGLSGVNEVLQCTSMKDQTSTTFVQALAATSTNPYYYAQPYYTSSGGYDIYSDKQANECVCEVDFNDVRPHVVTGLSVWLETAAHSTTTTPSSKWTADQTPAGVALYLPWQSTSALAGYVFSMDSENTQTTDTSGTEYWYAFGVSPLSTESLAYSTTHSAGVAVPISREGGALTGTQQKTKVIVSRSNLDDKDIGKCHSLAGGALGLSGYNLSVAVDSFTTTYARLAECDPSTRLTQITDFRWFKLGGAPRLMAVGGAAAHEGASPVRIEVFDWREAHSLRGVDLRGRELRISRGQGPRNLEPGAFTLTGATWEAQGARGEPVSANVGVRVAHTCAAPPPPSPAGNLSLLVSWENLNEWANRALGLPLSTLVDIQVPMETAAFRMRIDYEPKSSREVLVIEAVGAGELDRVPVVRRADGHWSFDLQRPKLKLRGGLVRLPNGSVELRIVSGEVGAPGEAFPITPFQSAVHLALAALD